MKLNYIFGNEVKHSTIVCLLVVLGGCMRITEARPEVVPFGRLIESPASYRGHLIELECYLTTDGFETQWLLRSLDIQKETPIRYSLAEQTQGADILRSAMQGSHIASVRVCGRFEVLDHVLPPGNLSFKITRVISAGPVAKPNQRK